jgi:hypothetical protein
MFAHSIACNRCHATERNLLARKYVQIRLKSDIWSEDADNILSTTCWNVIMVYKIRYKDLIISVLEINARCPTKLNAGQSYISENF